MKLVTALLLGMVVHEAQGWFIRGPCFNHDCSSKPYSVCRVVNDKAVCVCRRVCPRKTSLVCGSDGRTYDNVGEMRRAACRKSAMITVRWKGHCNRCYKYDCTSKPYSTCKVVNDTAECACPEVCPPEINPVCGSDGVTYNNECQMRRAACRKPAMLTVSWQGHCNRCYRYDCSRKPYSTCKVVNDKPVCACPVKCPNKVDLVCGSDGVTYDNECKMRQASCRSGKNITVQRKGICDLILGDMQLAPTHAARRPRDIVIVADSSDDVVWPAMLHFIKQVVGGLGASSEGNHYSIVTFARGAIGIVTFPVGRRAISQYSAPMVQRFIEAGAARRSRGSRHNIDVALSLARILLTRKLMGARPKAQKDVLVITGGAWGPTPAAAGLRKMAAVYAIGVRQQVQEKHLQQITGNAKRNFLVGSYPELRNYWPTFRNSVDPDRCYRYDCSRKPYSTCKVVNDKPVCACPVKCPNKVDLVCGSDGVTYDNECKMRQASCRSGKNITVQRKGICDLIFGDMQLAPTHAARRPRDIVIVADSSDDVVWPAMLHFIKQVVGGLGASPEGNHYSILTFANGAMAIVTFPVGRRAISQYSAPMVQRFIEAGAARRSRGSRHDIDVTLRLARMLLTTKFMGARPKAQKNVLVITGGAWGPTPAAAGLRKMAAVYAIGVTSQVQEKHLQQVTDNAKRNFLVGSFPALRNYWTTLKKNFETDPK